MGGGGRGSLRESGSLRWCFLLVGSERIVRRPFKLRVEVRTASGGRYTVTLVAGSSRLANVAVRALEEAGYKGAVPVVDRYGYLRVVYRGLEEGDVAAIKDVLRAALLTMGRRERERAAARRPQAVSG